MWKNTFWLLTQPSLSYLPPISTPFSNEFPSRLHAIWVDLMTHLVLPGPCVCSWDWNCPLEPGGSQGATHLKAIALLPLNLLVAANSPAVTVSYPPFSSIHAWFLTGPFLCRASESTHSCCGFLIVTTVSCPDCVSRPFSPSCSSFILSSPSSTLKALLQHCFWACEAFISHTLLKLTPSPSFQRSALSNDSAVSPLLLVFFKNRKNPNLNWSSLHLGFLWPSFQSLNFLFPNKSNVYLYVPVLLSAALRRSITRTGLCSAKEFGMFWKSLTLGRTLVVLCCRSTWWYNVSRSLAEVRGSRKRLLIWHPVPHFRLV